MCRVVVDGRRDIFRGGGRSSVLRRNQNCTYDRRVVGSGEAKERRMRAGLEIADESRDGGGGRRRRRTRRRRRGKAAAATLGREFSLAIKSGGR